MCNFVGRFCFARGNLVHGEAGGQQSVIKLDLR